MILMSIDLSMTWWGGLKIIDPKPPCPFIASRQQFQCKAEDLWECPYQEWYPARRGPDQKDYEGGQRPGAPRNLKSQCSQEHQEESTYVIRKSSTRSYRLMQHCSWWLTICITPGKRQIMTAPTIFKLTCDIYIRAETYQLPLRELEAFWYDFSNDLSHVAA